MLFVAENFENFAVNQLFRDLEYNNKDLVNEVCQDDIFASAINLLEPNPNKLLNERAWQIEEILFQMCRILSGDYAEPEKRWSRSYEITAKADTVVQAEITPEDIRYLITGKRQKPEGSLKEVVDLQKLEQRGHIKILPQFASILNELTEVKILSAVVFTKSIIETDDFSDEQGKQIVALMEKCNKYLAKLYPRGVDYNKDTGFAAPFYKRAKEIILKRLPPLFIQGLRKSGFWKWA